MSNEESVQNNFQIMFHSTSSADRLSESHFLVFFSPFLTLGDSQIGKSLALTQCWQARRELDTFRHLTSVSPQRYL